MSAMGRKLTLGIFTKTLSYSTEFLFQYGSWTSESNQPESNLALATHLEDSFFETRRLRHDGWDGPKKAVFCRTLSETGVVTEACRACGMSAKSAYALRQRDLVFARAWEVALSMARERLADELLARSFKGSVDQIMSPEGAILGERHHFDNKLAFAILRRLDRRAELGATFRTPPAWAIPEAPAALSGDWQLLLDALSEDRHADAELLLTPMPPECDKGNEGNDPPVEGGTATRSTRTTSPRSANASGTTGRATNGAPTSRRRPASTATNMAIGKMPRAIRGR